MLVLNSRSCTSGSVVCSFLRNPAKPVCVVFRTIRFRSSDWTLRATYHTGSETSPTTHREARRMHSHKRLATRGIDSGDIHLTRAPHETWPIHTRWPRHWLKRAQQSQQQSRHNPPWLCSAPSTLAWCQIVSSAFTHTRSSWWWQWLTSLQTHDSTSKLTYECVFVQEEVGQLCRKRLRRIEVVRLGDYIGLCDSEPVGGPMEPHTERRRHCDAPCFSLYLWRSVCCCCHRCNGCRTPCSTGAQSWCTRVPHGVQSCARPGGSVHAHTC